VKALYDAGYEVHFLVKAAFSCLLEPNPHIKKVWSFSKDLSTVLPALKQENFHTLIDLHNNLRSRQVKAALKAPAHTLVKHRLKLWLLTQANMKMQPQVHIVNRFLKVVEPLGISVPQPVTEFYFSDASPSPLVESLPQKFLCIAVGAAWATKEIPIAKLNGIIKRVAYDNVVLIGGPADVERGELVQGGSGLINLTGELSIEDSARVIERCDVLVTGDTGMMHIAAALSVPVVAIFGSTHPVLGYTPHIPIGRTRRYQIIEQENLGCRPCTKQGKATCPKGHFKCMNDISVDKITKAIESIT